MTAPFACSVVVGKTQLTKATGGKQNLVTTLEGLFGVKVEGLGGSFVDEVEVKITVKCVSSKTPEVLGLDLGEMKRLRLESVNMKLGDFIEGVGDEPVKVEVIPGGKA